MNAAERISHHWIWPDVGPTPISQGLDSEMFDRTDYPYTETFVREAVQNSLDAKLGTDGPVRISFTFHEGPYGQREAFMADFMKYRVRAGLPVPSNWKSSSMKWLVVQDFNSTGLEGKLHDRNDDFWGYWLNFGVSNKDANRRGGRGIGRVTFLIASQVQAVIGYTRRESDGRSAMCGMAVLRAYQEGDRFHSTHAYLARRENGSVFDLYDTESSIEELCESFCFERYAVPFSSGLALAVLYPHAELTPEKILAAIVENYTPAVMSGALSVSVDEAELQEDSIRQVANSVRACFTNDAIRDDPNRYLDLVQARLGGSHPHQLSIAKARKDELRGQDSLKMFQDIYRAICQEKKVLLNINFPITKGRMQHQASVKAIIAQTPFEKDSFDVFYRDGMKLPNVGTRAPKELDLILLTDGNILSKYLSYCEGKAHLDLLESKEVKQQLTREGFAKSFPIVKRFIKTLSATLRDLLAPETKELDDRAFDHYFSVPINTPRGPKTPPKPPKPPLPIPPARVRIFNVEQREDGFRISANPEFHDWPVNFRVNVAYADGTRHPLWSRFDFELNRLRCTYGGCAVEASENRLTVTNCEFGCYVEVTGFDVNRELNITTRSWKNEDDD